MDTRWPIAAAVAALLVAGCLADSQPEETPIEEASSQPAEQANRSAADDPSTREDGEDGNGTEEKPGGDDAGNDTGRPSSRSDVNGTAEGDDSHAEPDPGWPPVEQARIRPGIGVGESSRPDHSHICTANFLFAGPGNATLYLGTAAHCVDDRPIGDPVPLLEGEVRAELAYSGWWVEDEGEHERDHGLDFALLALPDRVRETVHPAVLGHGGPTGLADRGDLEAGDEIRWWGNSSYRAGQQPVQDNGGFVCDPGRVGSPVLVRSLPPVVYGDSGSPAMTADGHALGPLVRFAPAECPTFGGLAEAVPFLPAALDQASARGMDVELVTWPLMG